MQYVRKEREERKKTKREREILFMKMTNGPKKALRRMSQTRYRELRLDYFFGHRGLSL